MVNFENIILTEELLVRIMVYEIRERNPSVVQFVPDSNAIKMIACYLKLKEFDKIIYSFGLGFASELLVLCEEAENYEMCIEIRNHILKYKQIEGD